MATKEGKGTKAGSPRKTAKVLGENVSALMAATPDLSSNPKMKKATGLSTSTLSRMRNGLVDANLDTLELIAAAFDIQPWQLLVPNLQPKNLPVMLIAGEREQALYKRFRTVAEEIASIDK